MDSTFGISELVCYEAPSGVDLRDVNLGIDINRAMLMMFMFGLGQFRELEGARESQ